MLKVNIVALGRDKDPWISEGIEHYSKLLARYCQLTVTNLPSLKKTASLSPAVVKKQEAERFLPYLEKTTPIALTDSGKTFDSRSFATFLGSLLASSGGSVTMLIGGPFGLADEILAKARHRLSLSPMTLSHQIVRLVLLEQLYRGFSILHNTDYHK